MNSVADVAHFARRTTISSGYGSAALIVNVQTNIHVTTPLSAPKNFEGAPRRP